MHGASDAAGAYPREGRVEPQDVAATIFHLLGYDPHMEIHDPLGQPVPISRGDVIREIVSENVLSARTRNGWLAGSGV